MKHKWHGGLSFSSHPCHFEMYSASHRRSREQQQGDVPAVAIRESQFATLKRGTSELSAIYTVTIEKDSASAWLMKQACLKHRRDRWNEGIRALGFALWVFPMGQFRMRFFPPLRPFDFHASPPPWSFWTAAFACCVLPYVIPRDWFRPLWFETRNLYEFLGLRLFRRAVPDGDWVNRQLRSLESGYRLIRNRADLSRHISEGIVGERTHLAFLFAGLFTTAYAWRLGETGSVVALFLGNAVFNFFPVLLQRYKRVRTARPGTTLK